MRHACCTALSFRCLPLHEYRLVSLTHVGTAFDIVADAAIAPLQLCSRPSNWGIIPAPALHAVDLTFVEHLHHPRASGILLLQKARRAAERRAQTAERRIGVHEEQLRCNLSVWFRAGRRARHLLFWRPWCSWRVVVVVREGKVLFLLLH